MLRTSLLLLLCLSAAWTGLADSADARDAAAPRAPGAAPLPFFYDLYTFRGQGQRTAVVAAFAVPAGLLRPERGDEAGVRYRFDVTLVLADTAIRWVSRTDDSVCVQFQRAPAAEHVLYTQLEVAASPSQSTVQRAIMTDATSPGIGQLYHSSYPIPDYSGDELMLSDVALGLPGAAGGWRRGGVQLALLPTSQLPESAFDVYYEIYNLPAGHRYTTEISVTPEDSAGVAGGRLRSPVRIRFSGHAATDANGTVAELRRVETSLEPGRYRLTVRVTDEETARSASRVRVFRVRGWQPGATLVAGRPVRER